MFLLASLSCTYSSNVMVTEVLWVATFVALESGKVAVITGGIVSFGPPVGAPVVLAQDDVWVQ